MDLVIISTGIVITEETLAQFSKKHRQEQCIPGRDEKLKYKESVYLVWLPP
jgi:hypothetical protein